MTAKFKQGDLVRSTRNSSNQLIIVEVGEKFLKGVFVDSTRPFFAKKIRVEAWEEHSKVIPWNEVKNIEHYKKSIEKYCDIVFKPGRTVRDEVDDEILCTEDDKPYWKEFGGEHSYCCKHESSILPVHFFYSEAGFAEVISEVKEQSSNNHTSFDFDIFTDSNNMIHVKLKSDEDGSSKIVAVFDEEIIKNYKEQMDKIECKFLFGDDDTPTEEPEDYITATIKDVDTGIVTQVFGGKIPNVEQLTKDIDKIAEEAIEKDLAEHSNKYMKEIKPGVFVDVYDVLKAFDVTCPALQHAVKKLLMPGSRGHKDFAQDLNEAIEAINRSKELNSKKKYKP